jgi:3-oxoacyl-[acyl-carrier protein] reductase
MSDSQEWFKGRVALVTGASSGMGLETAVALGEAGAKVGIHYRGNRDGAASALARIESSGSGGEGVLIQADVGKREDIERMFAELETAFGPRIDMLVNNAGDWMDKEPIAECRESQWDHVFNVNVKSVFLCSQLAAKKMIEQGEGGIVNLGSVAGHTGGGGGTVPYAAAKAAVHTFTRGLSKELAPHGIRVNCVAPGMIYTPMIAPRVSDEAAVSLKQMTPLGRFGEPKEIAGSIMYLLSPAASYVTGEIHEVNGGLLMR